MNGDGCLIHRQIDLKFLSQIQSICERQSFSFNIKGGITHHWRKKDTDPLKMKHKRTPRKIDGPENWFKFGTVTRSMAGVGDKGGSLARLEVYEFKSI